MTEQAQAVLARALRLSVEERAELAAPPAESSESMLVGYQRLDTSGVVGSR